MTPDLIARAARDRYHRECEDRRLVAAVAAEREACASIVDGETCAGSCDCFSCAMLNAIAAAIRARAEG